jgi:2'-hydroxyisoflavone reductase
MKLLVIGGTMFVGKHCVEVALGKGHEVTLFNRGKHGVDLFPGVERIVGDRAADLGLLAGRKWDAVIDTCGYVPRVVRASAQALADSVDHYTFVSSISVYSDVATSNQDESAPVAAMPDETVETVDGDTYGPLKALCEKAVEQELPGRVFIPRPTLIVGPDDPTDRFTYWPARFARGGQVLIPNRPEQPVQIIDVRDLAEWMVDLIERGVTGTFNAAGPSEPMTMGDIYDACLSAADFDADLSYVDEAFLLANGVSEWSDLPLWLAAQSNSDGMDAVSVDRAVESGLTYRALDQTVVDTLAWHKSRGDDYVLKVGLTADREAALLAQWQEAKV